MSLTWSSVIAQEQQQTYLKDTLTTVAEERAQGIDIFPTDEDVFSAFDLTALKDVKVVILGQDPYHGINQAHGLAFSVKPGIKIPPSLRNMYKELASDINGFEIPKHGYLIDWAKQGVLLLNTVLTVRSGQAHSHKSLGWEQFTDKIISTLNEQRSDLVFLLWGSHAQKKAAAIDSNKHHILNAPHPSPLSAHRGFFGCKHFSKTNEILKKQGQAQIDWQPKLILDEAKEENKSQKLGQQTLL
ncbi:uracil-DNA glycosylase [uncultured Psychrosphaera sp.]|uniref:uracil-DNA glycosylase n=1 Tax=uncultured Psychrosphaera sp. TaxID=1403522 RepID=UPI0026078636|nr:uracil-DNA glycosylase [uncultured Psychrosphaera sp.]